MSRVYIGVGSNKGNREEYIKRAINHLKQDEDIEVKKVSSIIETEPQGNVNQDKFLNLAIELETFLDPYTLFKRLKNIERLLGRKETEQVAGPREIDLDTLLFDDLVIRGKNLKIPHPLMHTRYFVLKPLCELDPNILHPVENKTILELLNGLDEKDEDSKELKTNEQDIKPDAADE